MDAGMRPAGPSAGGTGPPLAKRLEELLIGLRRSSKDLAFYPPGHPALDRSVERTLGQLHAVMDVNAPLTLAVTRTGFSFQGRAVGAENRQLTAMAAELFVKRIQKIFFAEGVEAEELAAFLRMIGSDPKQLVQQGGPGKVLLGQGVRRIQVNEFDFQRLGAAPGPAGRAAAPGGPGAGGRTQSPGGRAGVSEIGAPSGQAQAIPGGASGLASATRGIEAQGAGVSAGAAGPAGGAIPAAADASVEGPAPAGLEAVLASLGRQEEQTVEALIQRLEREAAAGEPAGYDQVVSRLEVAAGQAVRNDQLADLLAILRVLFLQRQADGPVAPPLRERAAQAIGKIASGETVPYLVKQLGGPEGGVEADLAAILPGLGTGVIPALLGRLAGGEQGPSRERLAAILARFGEAAVPDLSEAVKTAGPELACDVATILGEIGGEAGVGLLARLARHEEVLVRAQAVRELGRIGGASAHRLLVQALRDSDQTVLELAIGLLGTGKVKQAVPALLRLAGQPVLTGTPFAARKAAVAALGAVGDPVAIPTLGELLHTRTWLRRAAGDELRQAAALALLAMSGTEAPGLVEAGARSGRADVRRACGAALQKTSAPAPRGSESA